MLGHRPVHRDNDITLPNTSLIAGALQGTDVDRLTHVMLEPHWRDDADIAGTETLTRLARDLDIDPEPLFQAAATCSMARTGWNRWRAPWKPRSPATGRRPDHSRRRRARDLGWPRQESDFRALFTVPPAPRRACYRGRIMSDPFSIQNVLDSTVTFSMETRPNMN